MKISKTLLTASIILVLCGFFAASAVNNIALAQYDWNATKQQIEEMADDSPIKTPEAIFEILAGILRYAYTIFFIVAVIFILVAAFNFLTAKDNPEKIKGARSQILWAAVAIAIALISVGVARIIQEFLEHS
jgi:phosphoglycerol transferase MdoB-like AlkP superfamily enzyme